MEVEIPFTSSEGYEYSVIFEIFKGVQKDYGLPIIDVSIILKNNVQVNNNLKTLLVFSNIVLDYLKANKVVLYYYCDTTPLYIRNTRQITMSPQEYRSILFSKIFERSNPGKYREKTVRISDPENGDHFTTLIFRKENQNVIKEIKEDLKSMEK